MIDSTSYIIDAILVHNSTTPIVFSVNNYFKHNKTHFTSSEWNVTSVDAVYIRYVLADLATQ